MVLVSGASQDRPFTEFLNEDTHLHLCIRLNGSGRLRNGKRGGAPDCDDYSEKGTSPAPPSPRPWGRHTRGVGQSWRLAPQYQRQGLFIMHPPPPGLVVGADRTKVRACMQSTGTCRGNGSTAGPVTGRRAASHSRRFPDLSAVTCYLIYSLLQKWYLLIISILGTRELRQRET